jgi:hypothetical protein
MPCRQRFALLGITHQAANGMAVREQVYGYRSASTKV